MDYEALHVRLAVDVNVGEGFIVYGRSRVFLFAAHAKASVVGLLA